MSKPKDFEEGKELFFNEFTRRLRLVFRQLFIEVGGKEPTEEEIDNAIGNYVQWYFLRELKK